MHSNICSLLGNIEKVAELLIDLDFNFDVLALRETWHCNQSDNNFKSLSIPGYQPYKGIQGLSPNGECGLFVKDNLDFVERPDLNKSFKSNDYEFEAFWIELNN